MLIVEIGKNAWFISFPFKGKVGMGMVLD